MTFLHIPYLVITDIDSVKPTEGSGRAKACCATDPNAVTSNPTLKNMFAGKLLIDDFNKIPAEDQSQQNPNCVKLIAFRAQKKVVNGSQKCAHENES